MYDGIINVYKEKGFTSFDVVAKMRGILGQRKVGHTGTLDPDAEGVLPVCAGKGTRLCDMLTDHDKTYRATMLLGVVTDTQDTTGKVLAETDTDRLTEAQVREAIQSFAGDYDQIPPMYSAIKKDGQPLYKLARQGIDVEVEPRPVVIHEIKVLMYQPESAMLEIRCGKGTYIRTLCQDIARACGSSGHMAYLMRTKSGVFGADTAVALSRLEESEHPEQFLMDMNTSLADMPALAVKDAAMLVRVQNGLAQRVPGAAQLAEGTVCRALDSQGNLVAIGTIEKESFQPNKVFKSGETV